MTLGRFGKYSLLNAGIYNYSNFVDLPEIYQKDGGDFD